MRIYLIRHGKTAGNALRKYIGVTDECVSDIGLAELEKLQKLEVDMLFCSPRKRCVQTAEILISCGEKAEICEGLAECDFGDFENKTAVELAENSQYNAWVESGCTLPIPNGESMETFKNRSVKAFFDCVEKAENGNAEKIAIVSHGGTAMAVMSHLFFGEFYSYTPENGGGYVLEIADDGSFENLGKICDLQEF